MRKYLFTLLIAAFLPLAGGHVLTKLWQNFDSALKADKPQDEMKALDAIKKKRRASILPGIITMPAAAMSTWLRR